MKQLYKQKLKTFLLLQSTSLSLVILLIKEVRERLVKKFGFPTSSHRATEESTLLFLCNFRNCIARNSISIYLNLQSLKNIEIYILRRKIIEVKEKYMDYMKDKLIPIY